MNAIPASRMPKILPSILAAAIVVLGHSRARAETWGLTGSLAAAPILARGVPGVGASIGADVATSRRTAIEGGIDAVMNGAYLSGGAEGEMQARYRIAGFVDPMDGRLRPRAGASVGLLQRSYQLRDDELAVHLGLHLQAVLQTSPGMTWFAEAMPTTILGDLSSGASYDGIVVFRLGARMALGGI